MKKPTPLTSRPLRTPHQRRIEEFMKKAVQDRPDRPVVPSAPIRKLRATLILEEALETVLALGFTATVIPTGVAPNKIHSFNLLNTEPCDIIEVVDGCCDISVVTIGTLSAFGIDDDRVLTEVDNSNLRKFDDGGHLREDGKWIKPPGWEKPAILERLKEQGYEKEE